MSQSEVFDTTYSFSAKTSKTSFNKDQPLKIDEKLKLFGLLSLLSAEFAESA